MAAGRLIVLAAAISASPIGCGGDSGYPPAAEPATSPPLTGRPAGSSFRVGAEPEGLVVDGPTGLAAVITRDPSELRLADLDRRRVVARVELPATGRHLGLAGPGGPVLVPVEQSDELIEVELPSADSRAIAVGDHPHDAVAAAGRVFVGNEFADTVSVLAGDRATATIEVAEQPGGLAAAGDRLVVVAVAARTLSAFDARTLEPLGEVDAGEGPTHVVAAGNRAWIADTEGDAILEIDLATTPPQPVSTTEVAGAPYGIAIDQDRERLWVALGERNEVVEYDVSGGRPAELARYPTLQQPNSVAVDPRDGSAVVAGRTSGRLQLIPGRGG